jgi:hypothetical protein
MSLKRHKSDHFEKFPLLTEKQADFVLFKEIVTIMSNKQHLNIEGLNKILMLKSSLNKGLTTVPTYFVWLMFFDL